MTYRHITFEEKYTRGPLGRSAVTHGFGCSGYSDTRT